MAIAGILGGQAFAGGVGGPVLDVVVMPCAIPGGILCTICAIVGLIFVVQIRETGKILWRRTKSLALAPWGK